MKKYKYSRKNIVKMLNQYVFDSYTVATREDFEKILLAKESKEEQSQKIMMEQVPKDKLEYDVEVKIYRQSTMTERVNCPEHWKSGYLTKNQVEAISDLVDKFERINKSIKQDKPVNSVCNCWRNLDEEAMKGEHGDYCNSKTYPLIEDTNKTSLVPEKIENLESIKQLWQKQCEILDYLTLISLDKK